MTEKLYIYNQQSRQNTAYRYSFPWVVIFAKDYRGPEKFHNQANPEYRIGYPNLGRFKTLAKAMDFAVEFNKHARHEVP